MSQTKKSERGVREAEKSAERAKADPAKPIAQENKETRKDKPDADRGHDRREPS